MSRILADMFAFSRQYLRNVAGPFFAFAFPILLILVFGAIFTNDGGAKITLPVQDLDDGVYSGIFLEILENTSMVEITEIPADVDISAYIEEESLSLALYIPADFTERLTALQTTNATGLVNLTLYGDQSRTTYGTAVGAVNAAVVHLNYYMADATPTVSFDTRSVASEEFNYMDFFLPGVVGITVMTNSLFIMTSICAEYRTRGYFKLLATTGIRKHEWLVSKFIFFTLLLVLSLLVTYAVGRTLFDMESSLTLMSIVLIAVGTFLFTSLGMLLGIIVKDPESGAAVANAIGFPMMFLSGAFFPLESMPQYLQTIAAAMPLTYFNEGLRDTMLYGNLESALMNLAVMLVIAVVFFALASRLMSWKER